MRSRGVSTGVIIGIVVAVIVIVAVAVAVLYMYKPSPKPATAPGFVIPISEFTPQNVYSSSFLKPSVRKLAM